MTEAQPRTLWLMALRVTVIVIVLSACAGFFVAFFEDDSHSQRAWLVAAAFAFAGAAGLFQLSRDARTLMKEFALMPSRERTSSMLMLGALAAGVIGGIVLMGFGSSGEAPFPAVGSLSTVAALIMAGFGVTFVPWLTWRWWRVTDEHDRLAYVDGAHIAASAVLCGGIGWWVLSRAALVPPPDGAILLIALSFIWSAVWLYRKYG